jgi:uncharacterized protein
MRKIIKPLALFLLFLTYPILTFLPFSILNPDKINIIFKIGYIFLVDILILFIFIYSYRHDLKKDLKDFKKNYKNYIDEAIKYWIIGLIIMVTTNTIINYLTHNDAANNEKAVRDMLEQLPLYMAFATVIFAPITEELIFRKAFKDMFSDKWFYIIMSGLVFGGLHVVSDFSNFNELLYIIPYGALGSAFAYLYYKTNNIYNSIIMHAVHNGTLVLLFLLTK